MSIAQDKRAIEVNPQTNFLLTYTEQLGIIGVLGILWLFLYYVSLLTSSFSVSSSYYLIIIASKGLINRVSLSTHLISHPFCHPGNVLPITACAPLHFCLSSKFWWISSSRSRIELEMSWQDTCCSRKRCTCATMRFEKIRGGKTRLCSCYSSLSSSGENN